MGSFANPSSSPAWDIQPDRRLIGVCYYPELFLLSEVEPDLRRIRDIGFNAIRIAEGAWAHFEPAEGQYRFDLFDTVLDLAHRLGLSVVFGTPTYCGPAWIARRYPETLRHDFHRRPLAHGSRRCYTYNSPTYQRLCDQITGTLADRYAKHPAIVAWQIDNEFNCHSSTSYAPDDTRQFRRFLRERYGEIDRLNDAWGTRFWSQCYDSFEQVDLPAPTPAPPNPHQLLDEQRFINDSVIRFLRSQVRLIRARQPTARVTHNALFDRVSGPDLAAEIDFFSHDQYPSFSRDWHGPAMAVRQARSLSFPFAILEQQVHSIGQVTYQLPTPAPGQIVLWAWQSIAHGCSDLFFFPYRTFPYGAEQLCRGLIEHDGRPSDMLDEVRVFVRELSKVDADFFRARPTRQIALLRHFESECDDRFVHINRHADDPRAAIHRAADRLHLMLDEVWSLADADAYPLLIIPDLRHLDAAQCQQVEARIRAGQPTLISIHALTCTPAGHLKPASMLRSLREALGVEPGWHTHAGKARFGVDIAGVRMETTGLTTTLTPVDAETVGVFSTDAPPPLGGRCAIARRGNTWTVGCSPTVESAEMLLTAVANALSLSPIVKASQDVEAIERVVAQKRYICLLNHGHIPAVVTLPSAGDGASLELPPLGMRIEQSAL